MTDADPVIPGAVAPAGTDGDLPRRIASALVMAALAIAATLVGGWPFAMFWTAAALVIFWEWTAIVADQPTVIRWVGAAMVVIAAALAGFGAFGAALALLMVGAAMVGLVARGRRPVWSGAGVVYAGSVAVAPVVLRHDAQGGVLAILFLFAVVWATDILGFFAGRLLGGPKLAVRISPNKTWSGAAGGTIAAIAAGVAVIYSAGHMALSSAASVALLLSIVSQAGDLFESAVKRRFGVKDASHVIPGHGGLMDRLDGFLAAASVAAVIGLARGGSEASARGLLMW